MPEIRAIISDLDDTLLNEHHQMTDRTAGTLQRLTAQGVKVILASGRSAASIRPFVRAAGTPWPYIACNGAQILDASTDLVLSASEVPLDLSRAVLGWFEARGVYVQYYDGDGWFYETPCEISEAYGTSSGIPGTRAQGKLSQCIARPTPKVLAIDTPERVRELLAEAAGAFVGVLSITTSKPTFIEITMPDATKGTAVRKLATMLSLTPETTLCAGDSLNDLSMLEWSKLPVSVANAREEVKAVAWRVAGDGRRDGLAELLDELIP